MARAANIRSSNPSKRPQIMVTPGPDAISRTRACVNGFPRGVIAMIGAIFGPETVCAEPVEAPLAPECRPSTGAGLTGFCDAVSPLVSSEVNPPTSGSTPLDRVRNERFWFSICAAAKSTAAARTSARKTIPAPPPAGVSSTDLCLSVAKSRI